VTPRFVRFCLVGASVTALNYALLIGFAGLGLHYVAANSLGWLICVGVNFLLSRRFTFRPAGAPRIEELAGFATTYVLQYLLATAVLVLLVEGAGLALTPAFAVTLVTTTLFSYLTLARFVFGQRAGR
jgi:putative flippase GtrA